MKLLQRIGQTVGVATCFGVAAAMVFGPGVNVASQTTPSTPSSKPLALQESPQRARPPAWSIDVLDAFFTDARTMLVGPRPDFRAANRVAAGSGVVVPAPKGVAAPSASLNWSKLIDAETIETEIKRLAQAVTADVTMPGPFKGGGFRACERHFSQLAVLFAVSGEYDKPIRWKDAAAGLRDLFGRAGHNMSAGTDETYAEATARKQDLADLVRGSRPSVPAGAPGTKWGQVSDRPPLMQRFNVAHQERLTKWLASDREFAANREGVRHEAQIIAMLAAVISREGFLYWDDEQYAALARELREAATEAASAAELNNYDQARRAIDRAGKACVSCHEAYRG